MDAKQIRSLKPELRKYLKRFDVRFKRSDTRDHLLVFVEGQPSDLPRKNCDPIADSQSISPRTLQQFLGLLNWDQGLMKTKLQESVAIEFSYYPASLSVPVSLFGRHLIYCCSS